MLGNVLGIRVVPKIDTSGLGALTSDLTEAISNGISAVKMRFSTSSSSGGTSDTTNTDTSSNPTQSATNQTNNYTYTAPSKQDEIVDGASDTLANAKNLTFGTITIRELKIETAKVTEGSLSSQSQQSNQSLLSQIFSRNKEEETKSKKQEQNSGEDDERTLLQKISDKVTSVMANTKQYLTEGVKTGQIFGDIAGAMVKIPAGIAGVGALITGAIMGIVAILKRASPLLRDISDLIEGAFGMILEPIGIILAQELAPVLSSLYKEVGQWFGEAREIYDKEGWVGLITQAIKIGWTMFLEVATQAFDILLNGFDNVPILGNLFKVTYTVFDWLASNLKEAFDAVKIYLAILVGLKTAEATTGIFGKIPGLNLLVGAGVGIGAYAVMDEVSNKSGLTDLIDEIQTAYDEFKIQTGRTSSYTNTYTSTVATSGQSTYTSQATTSNIGGTYNNYYSFNGYNTDEMVKTIQTEVNKNVRLSRSYLGV